MMAMDDFELSGGFLPYGKRRGEGELLAAVMDKLGNLLSGEGEGEGEGEADDAADDAPPVGFHGRGRDNGEGDLCACGRVRYGFAMMAHCYSTDATMRDLIPSVDQPLEWLRCSSWTRLDGIQLNLPGFASDADVAETWLRITALFGASAVFGRALCIDLGCHQMCDVADAWTDYELRQAWVNAADSSAGRLEAWLAAGRN